MMSLATGSKVPSDEPRLHLEEPGLWVELRTKNKFNAPTPALFLDRDGVINEDTHYVGNPDDVKLIPKTGRIINRANRSAWPVIIITNQSGIARGYYTWNDFHAVQEKIYEQLKPYNATIDAVLACAYHKDGQAPLNIKNHPMRKPNPGMILRAASLLPVILNQSIMIGDRESDMQAAIAAGLNKTIYVGDKEIIGAKKLKPLL